MEAAATESRPLDPDASEVLCFRVTVGEEAAPDQSGNVMFTFEATQVTLP